MKRKPTLHYVISTSHPVDIFITNNLLKNLETYLAPHSYSRIILLSDAKTYTIFGETIGLKNTADEVYLLKEGEESKSSSSLIDILSWMHEGKLDRRSAVVALGGGVVGDIATVAAGLYYRGIDCIQIPTTLLAQVDSSIGGKGAVNVKTHKNTIGIIRQPRMVLIDPSVLRSLPYKQLISGMGEILKYAIAMDASLFKLLEENSDKRMSDIESIIKRCVELKMNVVLKDPLDITGTRAILNFGHTLGQAIELHTPLTHGEAMSVGMAFAIRLSVQKGLLEESPAEKAITLIKSCNLPTTVSGISHEQALCGMLADKKTINNSYRFVLLTGIGKAITQQEVSQEVVTKTLKEVLV